MIEPRIGPEAVMHFVKMEFRLSKGASTWTVVFDAIGVIVASTPSISTIQLSNVSSSRLIAGNSLAIWRKTLSDCRT